MQVEAPSLPHNTATQDSGIKMVNVFCSRNQECMEDREDYFLLLDIDEHVQDDYVVGFAEHKAKCDNQLCAENKHIAKDSAYTTKRKEPTSKKRETGVSNLIVNENHPYSSNEITLSSDDSNSNSESLNDWYKAMLNRNTADCEIKDNIKVEIVPSRTKYTNNKSNNNFESWVRIQLNKNIHSIDENKSIESEQENSKVSALLNKLQNYSNKHFDQTKVLKNQNRINSLNDYNKSAIKNKSIMNLKSKFTNESTTPSKLNLKYNTKIKYSNKNPNPYAALGSLIKRAKSVNSIQSSKSSMCSVESKFKESLKNIGKTSNHFKNTERGTYCRHSSNFYQKIPKPKVNRNTESKKLSIYVSTKF